MATLTIIQSGETKTLTVSTGVGAQGAQGAPGSDATVTTEAIETALGYTPADAATNTGTNTGDQDLSGLATQSALAAETAAREAADGNAVKKTTDTLTDSEVITTSRNLGLLDHDSIIQVPQKLWKLHRRLINDKEIGGYYNHNTRFRVVTLGDSVACEIKPFAQGFYGYGGQDMSVVAGWTRESGAATIESNQFSRTPKGSIVTLNAGVAGGTYLECLDSNGTKIEGHANSLVVQYLAASGNGSFKVQYKLNHTGAWVDCGTVSISANGGSQASGVVDTDNGGAERFSTAYFQLPLTGYYDFRIQAVTGSGNAPVKIAQAFANSGAMHLGGAIDSYARMPGALSVNYAEGSKSLSTHFSQTTQQVWDDALGEIRPHVIVFKSLNGYTLSNYQTYWNDYAQKILAAAPDATLVVCGTHPTEANPLREGNAAREVDDFLRQWCAANDCIFVDVMSSFPDYHDDGSINDLNSDVVHLYGLGDIVVASLAWQSIEPACKAAMFDWSSVRNMHRPIEGNPNFIQLGNPYRPELPLNRIFRFGAMPSTRAVVGIDLASRPFNGSYDRYDGLAGFANDGVEGDLQLVSRGVAVAAWNNDGAHFTAYGTALESRARGFVFTSGRTYRPVMTVEGMSGQSEPIFVLATGATNDSAGRFMWEFKPDGSYTHKGASGTTILHKQDANFKRSSKGGTANAITGSFTLVAGVATINTTAAATNDHVDVTVNTPGGTMGNHYKVTVTNGTSITITAIDLTGATVTTDTSTGTWHIAQGRL